MEESQKVDYSELARLILDGYKRFPAVFFEHFCLESSYRYANYSVDYRTAEEVRSIFGNLVKTYDLSREEMKLITADGQGCCSNPIRQLARRWLTKTFPNSTRWERESPMIWRRNEIIIVDFSDPLLDLKVAECLFCESNGQQKVRLIKQFGNYFFPIIDQGNYSLSGNLNSAIPKVVVGPKYGDGRPEVLLDLNSVIYQKQELEFRRDQDRSILGKVNIYNSIVDFHGFYIWKPDLAGIYRAIFKLVSHIPRGSGKKKIEVLSTLMENIIVLSE